MLKEVAKKHDYWIKIAQSYGAGDYAEDAVQEMYLLIDKYAKKEHIIKNGNVNVSYVYQVIKNVCFKNYQKESCYDYETDHTYIEPNWEQSNTYNEDFEWFCNLLRKELTKVHPFYYERLYHFYTDVDNPSYRSLAKEIGIPYHVIFEQFKKIKELAKKLEKEYNQIFQK